MEPVILYGKTVIKTSSENNQSYLKQKINNFLRCERCVLNNLIIRRKEQLPQKLFVLLMVTY